MGDLVYYKRDNWNEWKGPNKVSGQNGNLVPVRHDSTYYKIHPCRISKVHHDSKTEKNIEQLILYNKLSEEGTLCTEETEHVNVANEGTKKQCPVVSDDEEDQTVSKSLERQMVLKDMNSPELNTRGWSCFIS